MKRFYKFNIVLVVLFFLGATSCTSDFEELNTDPNKAFQTDPAYLLSYSQNGVGAHRFELWRGNLLHAMLWSNQFITPWTTPFLTNDGWATAYWDRSYERLVGSIEETLRQIDVEGASDADDKKAITRIWRVFIYHRLTDFWGNVPYSEAGKGNSDRLFQPQYDTQRDIYLDMLNELKEAVAQLNNTPTGNTFGTADLVYGGDHADWIKFGNSLRLRLAMRLSQVDAATAQTHVAEVATASLITDNADNCRLLRLSGDQFDPQVNGSSAPIVAGFNGNYLSRSMVNILKDRNDPRLPVYALPNAGGEYVGYPNGTPSGQLPSLSPDNFSLPNPNTVFALDADVMFLSASEVNLLLAEAAYRGWANGDAATYYQAGIRSSLEYH
ncbi:MAG: SusD/RagB family nutrient-binding outer membrane lipoprotein, partial [Flammeovirgaceae bacterium]